MKYSHIIPFYQKLNYRCPKGTVDETFSCGKTPEERKENYDKTRNKNAATKTKTATKKVEKNAGNKGAAVHIERTKSAIEKVKAEMAAGQVSKESYKELKSSMGELRAFLKGGKPDSSDSKSAEKMPDQPKSTPDSVSKKTSETAVGRTPEEIKKVTESITVAFFTDKKSGKNGKLFDETVKKALDNAKSEQERVRIKSAAWMIQLTKNGDYDKLQTWAWRDSDIRAYQRGDKNDKDLAEATKDIERIIADGPKWDSETFVSDDIYRGIGNLDKKTFDKLINSKSFDWNELTASTINKDVAMQYATNTGKAKSSSRSDDKEQNSIVFKVKESKSGVYISDNVSFAGLGEVLIPSKTSYKVTGVKKETYTDEDNNDHVIHVMELEEITPMKNEKKITEQKQQASGEFPSRESALELLDITDVVMDAISKTNYFKSTPPASGA